VSTYFYDFYKRAKRENKRRNSRCCTPGHISATARVARTGPIYAIRLQARPGTDGIRALGAALKVLWRRYQLRCLEAREVKDGAGSAVDAGTVRCDGGE
jgi:hypothetical protein